MIFEDESLLTEQKKCFHRYLTVCRTNIQPPGFADYLRGTIALFNFSQVYGYKLLLDNSHPLFKYIKNNDNLISCNSSSEVFFELLPPISYINIFNSLHDIFQTNKTFSIMTNSMYALYNNKSLDNWGEISEECRTFLKNSFIPSSELNDQIENIMTSVYNISNSEPFKIIRIRSGDKFIHDNVFDDTMYNDYFKKVNRILNNDKYSKYVLISDSSAIANKLKENIDRLYYWNNKKMHLGDLYNNTDTDTGIIDTLTDFFIQTKSSEIINISGDSGFGIAASIIYNIKYTVLQ